MKFMVGCSSDSRAGTACPRHMVTRWNSHRGALPVGPTHRASSTRAAGLWPERPLTTYLLWGSMSCVRAAGMYLDTDVDCWREGSDMLEGYDLVIQVGERPF